MPIEDGEIPRGELVALGSGRVWVKCYLCRRLLEKQDAQDVGLGVYRHRGCRPPPLVLLRRKR